MNKEKYIASTFPVLCILVLFEACKDFGPSGEPCLNCPIDFRVVDFEPAWSPDGSTIAYVHGDTTPQLTGIWLIDTTSRNRQILVSSSGAYSPSWSPDGRWVVFSDHSQVYKITVDSDSLTQLTFQGRNFFPDWSLNGDDIVYDRVFTYPEPESVQGIWTMKSDGTDKRKVSAGRFPNWHPSGIHLIFIGLRDEIFRVAISDTSDLVRLTSFNQIDPFVKSNTYPKYSPDGSRIAFTSQPPGFVSQTHIWLMNADGSEPQQLTTTRGFSCDWSPDGELIVYTDSRSVNGRLWIMSSDGTNYRQLTFD